MIEYVLGVEGSGKNEREQASLENGEMHALWLCKFRCLRIAYVDKASGGTREPVSAANLKKVSRFRVHFRATFIAGWTAVR